MTYMLRRARARRLAATACAMTVAAVAFLAPSAARAFCRTTTVPIPANYSPTRGCFIEGLPLFWKGACVGYSLNVNASATVPLAKATSIIDDAFKSWSAVSCASGSSVGIAASNLGTVTCSEVRYNSNGPNQNAIIFRDDTWPYSDPNNTLGLTTVTFNADTGEIYDADMELNATGKNLSTSATVPANGFDLLSVVTHEAGHFLGLAHATSPTSTMFASYKPGTSALRTLSADDIAGVCEIYPTGAQRRVATSVSSTGVIAADGCDPTPRHGFGSACAENPVPADSKGSSGCAIGAAPVRTASGGGAAAALVLGLAAVTTFRRRRCKMV
jgi:hypothetical protein